MIAKKSISQNASMLLAVAILGGLAATPPATAATTTMPAKDEVTIHIDVGKSHIVEAPWPVKRVSVTEPRIADVQVLTPTQVMLMGKAIGSTDVLMWSADEQIWRARVDVNVNLGHLRDELGRLFPEAKLRVSQSRDMVIIAGDMSNAYSVAHLHKFFETAGYKYLDLTRQAGVQQVQLQVRVAEVSRTAIRALGINAFFTGTDMFGGSTIGSSGGGPINPLSIGPPGGASARVSQIPFEFSGDVAVSPSVTLFAGFPRVPLEFFIQALAENQYLRILAEPNLVALSGEEAAFLAGGEFPIPVVQGSTLGGGTSITVEYKEFGVRLRFRPIVLGEGAIRLHVAPEVSQLSDVGAVQIEGFRIPSVVTRKAETTIELKSGQTFAMAGLISNVFSGRSSRVPGLGDLPVLGALFRSVRYEKNDTELVVLVTASLVEPMSKAKELPVPGQTHRPPNDWELYAEGRIEGRPPRLCAADCERLKEKGWNQLKGPGAWATYESGSARSQAELEPTVYEPVQEAPATQPAGE